MMLELLMVRKADEGLRKSFLDSIEYLVYDELHVYKGRQGADAVSYTHLTLPTSDLV